MPPVSNLPNPTLDTGHQLLQRDRAPRESGLPASSQPTRQAGGVGAWIGAAIIVIILGFGALYFYGAYLNKKNSIEQLPFIPGDQAATQ